MSKYSTLMEDTKGTGLFQKRLAFILILTSIPAGLQVSWLCLVSSLISVYSELAVTLFSEILQSPGRQCMWRGIATKRSPHLDVLMRRIILIIKCHTASAWSKHLYQHSSFIRKCYKCGMIYAKQTSLIISIKTFSR